MSGLVAQHIAKSTSVLEADDFTALANYRDYEDPVEDNEQIYDEEGQQVEEIFEDDGSEDEEEREEYLDNGDDECYNVDDGDSASSVSEEEERSADADAFETDIVYDIAGDEEICESKSIEETEVVLLPSSKSSKAKSGNTLENSSMYCCNAGLLVMKQALCEDEAMKWGT